MMNRELQIYKIQEYLVKNGFDPEQIDVAAELDSSLTLPENMALIAEKYGIDTGEQPGEYEYCQFLSEKCELKCDAESCELFKSERCAGQVEPCPAESGPGRIFCYRDLLIMEEEEEEEENDELQDETPHGGRGKSSPGYGVTLYFIEGIFTAKRKQSGISIMFDIINTIAGHVKTDKQFDVSRAIEKLIITTSPIVSFVEKCINAGTGKTRCYNDARAAGVAIRKQTQLALYEYLAAKEETPDLSDMTPEDIPPAYDFFERVREFIRDELMDDQYFGQFEYIENELSECDASDIQSAGEVDPGDFVFEMGELQSATIKYFGHYRRKTRQIIMRIYPEFNDAGLEAILNKR